ncbi:MAG: hypothetical protein NTV86_08645 [Planctomycetota bacterium]|nr:hypothetical protein [Planctomycetota bacterium]
MAISGKVAISVPDEAIEKSFSIALDLVAEMRRVAFAHYGYDGWFATSNGKTQPEPRYDLRDFRYYPKCAAFLWGDHPSLLQEMGKRIFFDQHDGDGRLTWDPRGQCGIHVAQTAKHFSDYLRYAEQDAFVRDNWSRLMNIVKWALSAYDRDSDGLIEHGGQVPTRLWGLLVGEPYNGFDWDRTQDDVVVVASMEMCELLQLLADYAKTHGLPEAERLRSRGEQSRDAIERLAWDSDADYYYLVRRTAENRWYHSGGGINEDSRELDVTPYYAALVSGNDGRGRKVAEYARRVLMDLGVFPTPLIYPFYFWGKYEPGRFIPGGCFEESYYNCVRAFARYGMRDAVFTAINRRSDAHVRDKDCLEWYMPDGTIQGHSRDRYGISAGAHISAIIEGLFGIVPARFGFDEVNIQPAIPDAWADRPATISVLLPNSGFLKYTYRIGEAGRTLHLTLETDKKRLGNFRIPVAGCAKRVTWNGEPIPYDVSPDSDAGRQIVSFSRLFEKTVLEIGADF